METLVVGSRVSAGQDGINVFSFNPKTGALSYKAGFSGIEQPTYQCYDHSRNILYSVSETETEGTVHAFSVEPDLSCRMLYVVPSKGGSPCHLSLNTPGNRLGVSNYADGSFTVVDIASEPSYLLCEAFEGKGYNAERQERAHIHSSLWTKDGKTLFVADLGLDCIYCYQDNLKKRTRIDAPKGSGPRHMVLCCFEDTLFVAAELSSEVLVYRLDEETPRLIQCISTLPRDFYGENTAADIHINKEHRQLYVSNRGHDSIAIFAIDRPSSTLHLIAHTKTEKEPRNFTFSPDGCHILVANGSSNSVCVHRIAARTGIPRPCSNRLRIEQPVCLTFL